MRQRVAASPLTVPVAAAVLARGAFALALLLGSCGTLGAYEVDSWSYQNAAILLRSAGWLSPDWLLVFRTPGYPILLMPGLAVGAVVWVTVGIQIVLGAVTVWLVGDVARKLSGSERAGMLAAWAYALEPLAVVFPSLLLSETLYATLLMLALWITAGARWPLRLRRWAVIGLLLGVAAFVRPAGIFLPAVLAVIVLWRSACRPRARHAWTAALVLAICGAVVPGAWMARNALVNRWFGLSSVSVVNAYFFHSAAVRAEEEHVPFREMHRQMGAGHPSMYLAVHPEHRGWSQARILRWQGAEARRILLAHPWVFLRVYVRGMVRSAVEPGASRMLWIAGRGAPRGWLYAVTSSVLVAWLLVLAVFAARGVQLSWRACPVCALLVATAIYHVCMGGGPGGESRFRHPVMPALCVLAGVGASKGKTLRHGCISESRSV